MSEYKRRCENWLTTFGQWALPVSEAPVTFIAWTGLYNLAAALRRHVWIPKRDIDTGKMLLGSWDVYPNIYVLFIAKAGRARKSTTVNYTNKFVGQIPDITRSPEMITKEKLLSRLSKSPDASMYIVAPEFGEFIIKSGTDMFGFLTNAYDGKAKLDVDTHVRQTEVAENPCLNLIGATTPEWVSENMPESVIGGGFASRVIFIHEKKKRRSAIFYDDVDADEIERLEKDLLADIIHIGTTIHGPVGFTPDAKKFVKQWYESQEALEDSIPDKLSGYFERKPGHVLKTALLHHFAWSDSLILEKSDIEIALGLVEEVERTLPEVFSGIGKNKYVLDIKSMYDMIKTKGRVTEKEVFRSFYHAGLPNEIRAMLESLCEAGLVTLQVEAGTNLRSFAPVTVALDDNPLHGARNGDRPVQPSQEHRVYPEPLPSQGTTVSDA